MNLDALYARYQARVVELVAMKGYRYDINWVTRVFEGGDHNAEKRMTNEAGDTAAILIQLLIGGVPSE